MPHMMGGTMEPIPPQVWRRAGLYMQREVAKIEALVKLLTQPRK